MKTYILAILTLLVLGYKVGSAAQAQVVQLQAHHQAVFNQVFSAEQ